MRAVQVRGAARLGMGPAPPKRSAMPRASRAATHRRCCGARCAPLGAAVLRAVAPDVLLTRFCRACSPPGPWRPERKRQPQCLSRNPAGVKRRAGAHSQRAFASRTSGRDSEKTRRDGARTMVEGCAWREGRSVCVAAGPRLLGARLEFARSFEERTRIPYSPHARPLGERHPRAGTPGGTRSCVRASLCVSCCEVSRAGAGAAPTGGHGTWWCPGRGSTKRSACWHWVRRARVSGLRRTICSLGPAWAAAIWQNVAAFASCGNLAERCGLCERQDGPALASKHLLRHLESSHPCIAASAGRRPFVRQ